MKILMFGWEFPPYNSGGLGVACMGLTQALSSKGVDITFVLPKKFDVNVNYMKFRFADTNVKFIGVNSLLTAYATSDSYGLKALRRRSIYGNNLIDEVLRYAKLASEIASEVDHDIIHAHDWLSFLAGESAQEVSGAPLITHVHATEFDRTGGTGVNQQVFEIEKEGCSKANDVIAVSNLTKNILTSNYEIDSSKVHVVHNGISSNSFTISSRDDISGLTKLKELGYYIVSFVGRITLQKGPDYFLQVAKKVLEYNKKVLFVIAGSGDMQNQIIMEAAKLGISNRVLFAGFLRGEELSNLYKLSDVFVMPSVSEPFGLTALESLLHGTPILISKQSGVSEVVDASLKSDFWDVYDMADKILALTQYKNLRQVLSSEGHDQAMKCTWDKAADKTIEIYNHLLNT